MSKTRRLKKRRLKRVKPTEKECPICGNTFPLTAEYWDRSYLAKSGFIYRCKNCVSAIFKSHYVKFTQTDVAIKGIQGVMCPLYSKYCGECVELEDCFRIDDDTSDDEFPISLFVIE